MRKPDVDPLTNIIGQTDGQPDTRRPYVPPRIVGRERLEALATTCDQPSGGKDVVGFGCSFTMS